jgi:DNA-binding NarL/FixJ family response regulator
MWSRIQVGIADDDEFIREMLRRLVGRAQDMQVVATVEDGAEAVALADTGAIQVLILDLEMPKMGGLEALRRIRTVAPGVRVIIHSSHSADKAAAAMLDAGASAYLQKPCSFDLLVQSVRDASRARVS